MKYLSVCSGIEAATVAWKPLGWEAAAYSEIDPFCCSLLEHYYPDTPNLGDMENYKEWEIEDEKSIGLVCGGTPCQSFSIAGLRAGLDDPRGNLALIFLGIVDRFKPRWVVWENVPGVLSDRGNAFGQFVTGLQEIGYSCGWRILDAQYFGVPQRRRRVFVVGHLGNDWRPAAAVLFEPEGLRRDITPSRETGERVAPTISSRTKGRGYGDDEMNGAAIPCFQNTGRGYWKESESAEPVRNSPGAGAYESNLIADTASTLNASFASKQGLENQHIDAGAPNFIIQSLRSQHNPACCGNVIAVSNRGTADEIAEPVRAGCHGALPMVTHALKSRHDGSEDGTGRGTPIVAIQAGATRENPDSGPDGVGVRDDGVAFTVEARAEVQAVAQQVQWSSGGGELLNDTAQSLRSGAEHNYQFVYENHGQDSRIKRVDQSPQINAKAGTGGNNLPLVQNQMRVRRLLPLECERLQGFPDNWTLIPHKGKPASDSARYKALGNSMAVPCMYWLGNRINMMEEILCDINVKNAE